MLYVLKNLMLLCLPPSIFIIILFMLAVYLYRRMQNRIATFLLLITFLLYCSANGYLAEKLMYSLEYRYQNQLPSDADVIVLLGGGATADTPNLLGKGHLSSGAANRLLTALQLHQQTALPIIVTGGKVFADTGCEAEIAKRILVQVGVRPEIIFQDNQSLNTRQNAEQVKKILQEQGFSKPILVTSAYHMPRAMSNFQNRQITVVPFAGDYRTNQVNSEFKIDKFIPTAGAMQDITICLWEYVGLYLAK